MLPITASTSMSYSDTEALDSQRDSAKEGCVFLTNAPVYSVALWQLLKHFQALCPMLFSSIKMNAFSSACLSCFFCIKIGNYKIGDYTDICNRRASLNVSLPGQKNEHK